MSCRAAARTRWQGAGVLHRTQSGVGERRDGIPEVEDRMVFALLYRSSAGAERKVTIAINQWGAYRP